MTRGDSAIEHAHDYDYEDQDEDEDEDERRERTKRWAPSLVDSFKAYS